MSKLYDALIIGGGPAGLTSALVLGRVHRTAAIFANDTYRNDGAEHSHGVLSRDHVPAAEIRSAGRKDLERYKNTDIFETTISSIIRHEAGIRSYFVAKNDKNEEWKGRSVILASGVRDQLPDLPGYEENWPRSIYQCPVCDGHERSQGPVGVLCYPKFDPYIASHSVTTLHFLSQPVGTTIDDTVGKKSNATVFTNGPVDISNPEVAKVLETCEAHGVTVDQRPITRLEASPDPANKPGLFVHLQSDGTGDKNSARVFQNFLLHKPPTIPKSPSLLSQLGIELASSPFGQYVKTTPPVNSANVPGVFVAGDASTALATLTIAMSSGGLAAAGAMQYINERDNEIALERLRQGKTKYEL